MNTTLSVIIMTLMAVIGFFAGVFLLDNAIGSAILFAMISGIACIIEAINHKPADTEK